MLKSLFSISCLLLTSLFVEYALEKHLDVFLVQSPHIILILADDLGWNDVGYHNSDILTPNIDQLSTNGIRLNNSYMQPLCSPSRAAVLTGYYPFRSGMQHGVVWRHSATALPLRFELLPQKLKQAGYSTHLVGKWHLGHCNGKYLPTARGFDTSYGPFAGTGEYYTHYLPGEKTVDFFNNTSPVLDKFNIHSSKLYGQRLEEIFSNHRDSNKPLFLYLPFNLVHSPLEVDDKYLKLYPKLATEKRQNYSAMASALDDDIGNLVKMLKRYQIYHNSIIIFSADNGGQISLGGNNFPLRGSKNTLYEGGCRVVGFIHSPLLKSFGYVYNGLIHAVDWFATILGIANIQTDSDIDGINLWEHITNNLPSARTEFVYNIDNFDEKNDGGAYREGNWKLIYGKAGVPSEHYDVNNVTTEYDDYAESDVVPEDPTASFYQLFNLIDDPYEWTNLAQIMPEKVHYMMKKLQSHLKNIVKPVWKPNDDYSKQLSKSNGVLNTQWCSITEK